MTDPHDQESVPLADSSVTSSRFPGAGQAIAWDQPDTARDPLSLVLRSVKLTGALFFMIEETAPWCVEVPAACHFLPIIMPRAQNIISYHIVVEGTGCVAVPGTVPAAFSAGDILVFAHGDPYILGSEYRLDWRPPAEEMLQFFRDMVAGKLPLIIREGGGGESVRFVCGFLGCDARPFNPLLESLPRFLHVHRPPHGRGDLLDRLIGLTLAEAGTGRVGGECVRLGLSELIFVETVRRHLETLPPESSGWLAALHDPGVGRAIALLHQRPAAPWTVERLARQAGISRSVLAERFAKLVGQPPMQYLAHWRMQMASRLLADGPMKVSAIGREVGYESEAAFSRTFKKLVGLSPAAWRKRSGWATGAG
jgi:AraC-like DNA-binding protein